MVGISGFGFGFGLGLGLGNAAWNVLLGKIKLQVRV
jgi:hypothetical protein